jgi:GTP cyclohydrolase I
MDEQILSDIGRKLLEAIGEDPSREGLKKTPVRFAKSWGKLCGGYKQSLQDICTVFDAENFDEMILVRDIEFYSLCEHHILPFFGTVTIGYLPNKKILGLSKLPRIVDVFARRLQNQERLTMQIARAIEEIIQPRGVGVLISAQHLCMMSRGVEKQKSFTETSALRGTFKKDSRSRSEFLHLAR